MSPVPRVVIWAYRWLLFRIMIGAGLIKIRGDRCWHDLSCMDYHYETQPVPNQLSWYLHHNIPAAHAMEVAGNHFVELLAPWLLLPGLPRYCMLVGGVIQLGFQGVLIASGNLSFLNWLTMLPAILCFDDKCLERFFSMRTRRSVWELQQLQPSRHLIARLRRAISALLSISLGLTLAYLSVPVLRNLLQLDGRQAMNTSFGTWKVLNTYGAFGSITKVRTEIVLEGTMSDNPSAPDSDWLEFEFRCKPGAVSRSPCTITPYHYRLDWVRLHPYTTASLPN